MDNFGRYSKYAVTDAALNSSPATSVSVRDRGNAFEILMGSARTLQSKNLPDSVQEKNRKDKLYNDLLLMYRSRNLKMRAGEVDSIEVKLTRTLCDTLWHIDGHHEVFSTWSVTLPATFRSFSDYNLPELSKHRKRQRHNLSRDVFMQLKHISFPVPGEDGHYLPFSDVFGTDTSEEHRPSLKQQKSRAKSLLVFSM